MTAIGSSSPNKESVDKEFLVQVEPQVHERKRVNLLLPFLVFTFFLIFLSGTYYTLVNWNGGHSKTQIIIVPENDLIHIQVDGEIVVKTKHANPTHDNGPACSNIKDAEKFDCYPEPSFNESACLKRGCCWKEPEQFREFINGTYELGIPHCFFPADYKGYQLVNYDHNGDGLKATFKRIIPTGLRKEVQEVKVEIIPIDATRLRIKITDPNESRYESPYPIIHVLPRGKAADRKYDIQLGLDGHLVVTQKSNGVKIVDTLLSNMFYSDQLLQINIKVPYRGFYGLGERQDSLFRGEDWERFVLLNRDRGPTPDKNLYGSHPFYMQLGDDASSHGLFLVNSNIMEMVTQPTPGITFRPIGGIFDFYVIVGKGPADVVKQFQELVGMPIMPPYWSLGFHLCKYGYGSLEKTKEAYQRTKDAKIPFDVQWNDIDYMDRYNDFTYDKVAFKGLPEFVDELHKEGMRWVMIMDVGVSGAETPGTYPPLDDGLKMDIFIKNNSGDVLIAKVWNEVNTVFPDFTHPRANEYTALQYAKFYDQVKFDGSWIDMNEPSNNFEGSMQGCPKDSLLEHPDYIPGGLDGDVLASRTVCMSALHHSTTHYNLHNIHGLTNGVATNYALRTVLNKRPFVITRSSFMGQGVYTGHWSGDIESTWTHLNYSITSALSFSMYGVPMTGSDICGFGLNTTVELCARWHALGAFYAFSRNHNDKHNIDQDPASFEDPIVASSARKSLTIRYRLLPYLYTLFYRSHAFGETVMRPLFFEFPQDSYTTKVDTTFLWGPALMVIPILEQGTNSVKTYLPKDVWYNYYDGVPVPDAGSHFTFSAKLDEINLLVRGGHIIPCHQPALTTTESRKSNFSLIVALKDGQADGELYWDDGESIDSYENKEYNLISFHAEIRQNVFNLTSTIEHQGYDSPIFMHSVEVFGVSITPKTVSVNGMNVNFEHDKQNVKVPSFKAVPLLEKIQMKFTF